MTISLKEMNDLGVTYGMTGVTFLSLKAIKDAITAVNGTYSQATLSLYELYTAILTIPQDIMLTGSCAIIKPTASAVNINTAINTLISLGGGVVAFTEGTFILDIPLLVRGSNIAFVGCGAKTILKCNANLEYVIRRVYPYDLLPINSDSYNSYLVFLMNMNGEDNGTVFEEDNQAVSNTNIASFATETNSTNAGGATTVSALTDGILSSYATYSTNENDWSIGLTFPSAYLFNKIVFYSFACTERVKNFIIEHWNGTTWVKVPITSTGNNAYVVNTDEGESLNENGWNTAIFSPILTTQMRVRFTSSWNIGDLNAGIAELQMFISTKKVITKYGETKTVTATKKFGTASAYFDGDGDWIDILACDDFNFGNIPFTIECWIKRTRTGVLEKFFGQSNSSGTASTISVIGRIETNNTVAVYCYVGGIQYTVQSTNTLTDTTSFHHIAMVRSGINLTLYVDGEQWATIATLSTSAINSSTNKFAIGRLGEIPGSEFQGYIDGFAIYKGVAKYTSAFSVPTEALTLSGRCARDGGYGGLIDIRTKDPYTSFLMHLTGANDGVVFTEEIGKTPTVNGNTKTVDITTPIGTSATYFDGDGDYIDFPACDDFNFGAGDFTIECWVKRNRIGVTENICGQYTSGATTLSYQLYFTPSNTVAVQCNSGSTEYHIYSTNTLTDIISFHHITLVRSGINLTLYVDGVQQGTIATLSTNAINSSPSKFAIGRCGEYVSNPYQGHIAEFRISKGIARYTAPFTSPTTQFAIERADNVTVSNLVIDGGYVETGVTSTLTSTAITLAPSASSTNDYYNTLTILITEGSSTGQTGTITDYDGSTKVATTTWGYDTYTKLLLHMDGSDNGTTFTDETGKTVSRYDNTKTVTATKKIGTASAYFDGTGDYIDFPACDDFNFGAGDFTIECWIKRNRIGVLERLFGQSDSSINGTSTSFRLNLHSGNTVGCEVYVGATAYTVTSTNTLTDTTSFHHIAFVRSGVNLTLYVDGIQWGTIATLSTSAINSSTNKFAIGRCGEYTGDTFQGYIDEFRISKGIARYTAPYNPSLFSYSISSPNKKSYGIYAKNVGKSFTTGLTTGTSRYDLSTTGINNIDKIGVTVNDCIVKNNLMSGIYLSNSNNIKIENSDISNSANGVNILTSKNIILYNNKLYNNLNRGFTCNSSYNIILCGNLIVNNSSHGIVLDPGFNCSLNSNQMLNNGGNGIYIGNANMNQVIGNSVSGNGSTGIVLSNTSKTSVSGNLISNNGSDGVYSELQNYITGNSITYNKGNGVQLSSSSYSAVSGNTVYTNMLYGIRIISGSSNMVFSNQMIGNITDNYSDSGTSTKKTNNYPA